jgi:hypothetical protein
MAEFKRALESDPSTLLEAPLVHIDPSIGRVRVGLTRGDPSISVAISLGCDSACDGEMFNLEP